jgi:quercetin dioxygenase-like cupin family protein
VITDRGDVVLDDKEPIMKETVLDRAQVQAAVLNRTEGPGGVHRAILWEQGGSTAGLLALDSGVSMPEHTHRGHCHHVWVVSGTATVLGRQLEPRSYFYVPPGTPHATEAGPDGCELFYLYLEV